MADTKVKDKERAGAKMNQLPSNKLKGIWQQVVVRLVQLYGLDIANNISWHLLFGVIPIFDNKKLNYSFNLYNLTLNLI